MRGDDAQGASLDLARVMDQQEAKLDVSVILRTKADGVDDLYQQYGSLQGFVDRVVAPRVNQQTKIVFGRFNAETAIRERGRLNTEIEAAVAEHVGVGKDSPVVIESVFGLTQTPSQTSVWSTFFRTQMLFTRS